MKINLFDYTQTALMELFKQLNEKQFHARQVFRWIHIYGVADFTQMSNISKSLQAKLNEIATIHLPVLVTENKALDGVIKWVLGVGEDGNKIETVFIPDKERGTLCISSQIGCALECQFCSTGRQGFNRNLTTGEIVAQLWWANKRLGYYDTDISSSKKLITNIVMMGMGEPLANYENVVNAMKVMLDDNAYNISKRKLTLSTSGIVPALNKLKDDCPVSLAVSLHASNNLIRDKIVPLNKKYPINDLLNACKNYLESSPKDYVTFEYVMLKNINDNLDHAKELVKLVNGIKCKFNLIPFNSFANSGFESSDFEQILKFQKILQHKGLITTIRKTRGNDIDAACGQLVGKVNDKTKRQEKWRKIVIPIRATTQ